MKFLKCVTPTILKEIANWQSVSQNYSPKSERTWKLKKGYEIFKKQEMILKMSTRL